jgi:hypothetical protein
VPKKKQNQNSQSLFSAEKLILTVLNTLQAFLDWTAIQALLQSQVLELLLNVLILDSETIKMVGIAFAAYFIIPRIDHGHQASIECIGTLFARNISTSSGTLREDLFWKPLFENSKIEHLYRLYFQVYKEEAFANVLIKQSIVELDEEHYQILKMLVQVSNNSMM